ncbi:MAG: AMP-binding protein [Flavobacteriaceae bacterium]
MQPKTPSRLRLYTAFLQQSYGLSFPDYDSLHQWSITEQGEFWESIARFFDVDFDTPYQDVFVPETHFWETKWFGGATLNYAQHIFKHATSKRPALVFQNEAGKFSEISWAQLIAKTYTLQQELVNQGVTKGDAVVCFGTNSPETIAAFLATNALGAVWSSCSPDFGIHAVCERFSQLQPKVLFAHRAYQYNGKQHDCMPRIAEIQKQIPSIQHTIFLDAHTAFDDAPKTINDIAFTSVSFSSPIWVLFSSGTTGKPKALVHGTRAHAFGASKSPWITSKCLRGRPLFLVFHHRLDDVELCAEQPALRGNALSISRGAKLSYKRCVMALCQ